MNNISNTISRLHKQAEQALGNKAYQQAHQCLLSILQQDRGYADAYYLLARIAFEHQNLAKAIELCSKAQSLAAKSHYLVMLAKLYVLAHDHVRASTEADNALRLLTTAKATANITQTVRNDLGQQWDDMGVIYSQVGRHVDAVSCFERAIDMLGDQHQVPWQLYNNLASSYKYIGHVSAADECYQSALVNKPDAASVHWALTMLRPNKVALNRLQAQFERAVGIDDKLSLAHACARKLEQQGHYNEAFSVLSPVKQQKKAQLSYRIEQDLRLFAALANISQQLQTAVDDGEPSDEPIFVVGMPRTGTTLIERVLSQSVNVTSAGEMPHFAIALKQCTGCQSPELLDEATIQASTQINWLTLGQHYIQKTRAVTGNTSRFIDKMPINFLYIPFIVKALPNAKIVCLDRDHEDTVVSNYRQLFASDFPFYRYSYDLKDCSQYYHGYQTLMDAWQQDYAKNIYRLKYESFVNDPIEQGRALFDFIGEPWQDEFINLANNRAPVATASATQVRDTISNQSVGTWRRYQQTLSANLV
ncbi:sulfotransferase [Thalassotalea maritima]|uniref:tetratricopeptide repeat-containing sulfotransferase family protein n=1 Tax=Thalassotalea maritima TaxID=3242416 RepID=UPI0035274211